MKTASATAGLDKVIRAQLADSLASAAKEAGLSLLIDQLTCDLGKGFTILAAPITRSEAPTEKELSKGVGLPRSRRQQRAARRLLHYSRGYQRL
jgi:hypothetical protein